MGMIGSKMLLPWSNNTLLNHVIGTVCKSSCDPISLVLGHEAQRIWQSLSGLLKSGLVVTIHDRYAEGMASSLQAGLRMIPRHLPCFLVLGDQPLLSLDMMREMMAMYESTGGKTIRPMYQGRPAHPVLLSPGVRPLIDRLSGDEGLKSLFAAGLEVVAYEVAQQEMILDVDTPLDYYKLLQFNRR
jgi:CTP:molybdopterin cytidylyltransferase MocA